MKKITILLSSLLLTAGSFASANNEFRIMNETSTPLYLMDHINNGQTECDSEAPVQPKTSQSWNVEDNDPLTHISIFNKPNCQAPQIIKVENKAGTMLTCRESDQAIVCK